MGESGVAALSVRTIKIGFLEKGVDIRNAKTAVEEALKEVGIDKYDLRVSDLKKH